MAVTPVGQNRPQPQPQPQTEAPQAAAQKSGGGGAVASARAQVQAPVAQDKAVQAQLARDTFQPAKATDVQAQLARDTFQPANTDAQAQLGQDALPPAGDAQAQAQLGQDALPPAGDAQVQAGQAALQSLNDIQDSLAQTVSQLPPDDPFSQTLGSLCQTLSSVVDLVKNILPPDVTGGDPTGGENSVGTNPDPATIAPGEPTPTADPNAPITRDLLDARGGGPAPGDPVPVRTQAGLGPQGPGLQGTQHGAFGVAGINQNDPNADGQNADYKFGQTNCGPTSMAEIARGKSLQDPNYSLTWKDASGVEQTKRVADMSNEELVSTLGKIGDTNDQGTSPNGVIDMANSLGEPVSEDEVKFDRNFEKGQPSNSFDQNWLDQKLGDGEKVVVNGAYEATDEKGNTGLVGHFMTIAGKNQDGTYSVMDPWDGKQKNLTADEVRRFMQANPTNGGIMLAIGESQAEKAQKAAQTAQG
ncbi:MAG TPA: hypothetical protein VFT91_07575 [Dehalococcoidia bacterium]|nr:hypothetical protein [Dehalococcoidia bacterium]